MPQSVLQPILKRALTAFGKKLDDALMSDKVMTAAEHLKNEQFAFSAGRAILEMLGMSTPDWSPNEGYGDTYKIVKTSPNPSGAMTNIDNPIEGSEEKSIQNQSLYQQDSILSFMQDERRDNNIETNNSNLLQSVDIAFSREEDNFFKDYGFVSAGSDWMII
ncbi:hypothetical protein [Sphingomonas sp. Leaf4]|uniref:hypothetical protein n=1 Tax=Sphingomonas sp. Leaf4 TaxID=2876553 RepID=UPI001E4D1B77|nr:hypothetical protein [Sphingomonas sp. Leaf4]